MAVNKGASRSIMAEFSEVSWSRLESSHCQLKELFCEVVKEFDCTILCGYRDREEQNRLYGEGRSKVKFPDSKHNQIPSWAVDAVPYPIDWQDRERITLFAGYVLGVAAKMYIPIQWGGDWNRDTEVKDNEFDDLPHFELI